VTVEDADANPTPEDAKPAPKPPASPASVVSDKSSTPGDLPTGKAPAIPDWYKIGWRAVSGIDDPLPEGVEKDKGILFQHISEQYYGDWYHNATIIIVVSILVTFCEVYNRLISSRRLSSLI
jgi:hypothetical protein